MSNLEPNDHPPLFIPYDLPLSPLEHLPPSRPPSDLGDILDPTSGFFPAGFETLCRPSALMQACYDMSDARSGCE